MGEDTKEIVISNVEFQRNLFPRFYVKDTDSSVVS